MVRSLCALKSPTPRLARSRFHSNLQSLLSAFELRTSKHHALISRLCVLNQSTQRLPFASTIQPLPSADFRRSACVLSLAMANNDEIPPLPNELIHQIIQDLAPRPSTSTAFFPVSFGTSLSGMTHLSRLICNRPQCTLSLWCIACETLELFCGIGMLHGSALDHGKFLRATIENYKFLFTDTRDLGRFLNLLGPYAEYIKSICLELDPTDLITDDVERTICHSTIHHLCSFLLLADGLLSCSFDASPLLSSRRVQHRT